jgi:hypothetical protein
MASWIEEHFGSTLTTKSGSEDSATALSKKKYVAIYFSAHWVRFSFFTDHFFFF